MRAWVVKGRPSENDFAAMRAGVEEVWHTRRPPKDWAPGDAVFLWQGAPALRLEGTAIITRIDAAAAGSQTFFTLRYTHDPLPVPLAVQLLRADPVLANASFLKSGPAGTVFPLSPSHAARLAELVEPHTSNLALSLRQPWAELVLRGIKTVEVRSTRTHKRERVLIYASEGGVTEEEETTVTRRYHLDVPGLARGAIVGSVEIVGCRPVTPADSENAAFRIAPDDASFGWELRAPLRSANPRAPERQPQPIFFRPFAR